MSRPSWLRIPVPDELAAPLGYALWASQYLEHQVYWVLRRLQAEDPPSQEAFGSFGALVASLRLAVSALPKPEQRKFRDWLRLLDQSVALRNDLAHATPVTTTDGTQAMFRRRPKQAEGIVRSTVDEIDELTKHFQEAILAGSPLLEALL